MMLIYEGLVRSNIRYLRPGCAERNVVVAVLGLVSGRVSGAFRPALRGAMQPARASVRWEDRVGVLTLPTRGSSNKRK